jgi:hypothetical protein
VEDEAGSSVAAVPLPAEDGLEIVEEKRLTDPPET